jgi:hypothetical protein
MLGILVSGVYMLNEPRLSSGSEIDVRVPLGETQEAQIDFDPVFAYLEIQPSRRTKQLLIEGKISPTRGEEIEQEIQISDHRLEAKLQTSSVFIVPDLFNAGDHVRWDIKLHPDVEYEFLIDIGAGKMDLKLEDLFVKSLDVDTGIGQTIIHLPGKGGYDAIINGGLGHVVVYLPDNLGVKLLVDVGIGAVDVPNDFRRQGEAYVSPNYKQVEETIEVDVSLGIGSLEIR